MTTRKRILSIACAMAMTMTISAAAQDPQSMLWDATVSGDSAMVVKALADGATIDSMDTRQSENGRRPLNWAAYHGHSAVVKLLLARGASVNLANRTGFTPLHHAAEMGHASVAAILLAAGANRNAVNANGMAPLDIAIERGHTAVAETIGKAKP